MSKKLSIHVTYGTDTFLHTCYKKEFLSSISKKLKIKASDINIFENETSSKKNITVDEMKPVMKVKIERKRPVGAIQSNGSRESIKEDDPLASTNRDEVIKKLTDNGPLTGKERQFLIKLAQNGSVKREAGDGPSNQKKNFKNCKLQVDPTSLFNLKSSHTQTDDLIDCSPQSLNQTARDNAISTQIKKLASEEKLDEVKAKDLMAKSYNRRRNFILMERPVVKIVQEKYLLLFSLREVRNELDRIFYDGKCVEFLENIGKYAPHILSLAREDDPLLLETCKKMETYKTKKQKQYAQEVGALLMAASIMNEDRCFLHLTDMPFEMVDYPYIQCEASRSALYLDEHVFKVYVEGLLLCKASDFKEAVLCLLAAYFIFNIQYPEPNFNTLVFFEKLFLEANDTDVEDVDGFVVQNLKTVRLKWQSHQN